MQTYWVFKRTAKSFEQFSRARKIKIETGLTREEAKRVCDRCNGALTPAQRNAGTRYEFTTEE